MSDVIHGAARGVAGQEAAHILTRPMFPVVVIVVGAANIALPAPPPVALPAHALVLGVPALAG